MENKLILIILLFLISSSLAFCQKYDCNYSLKKNLTEVESEACVYNKMHSYSRTDTLARELIEKILTLISLPTNFAIEPCDGINTCRAYVYDNGVRYIFYDPKFIKKFALISYKNWRLIAILAHELGHHLCGHTLLKSDIDSHRKHELEADQFAGSMLARMGALENESFLSLLEVEHPKCQEEQYSSYPCFEKRKEAVLRGFKSISKKYVIPNFRLPNALTISNKIDSLNSIKNNQIPTIPLRIDLSMNSSPARDQGTERSAVGFSIAYAIENEIKRKYNYNVSISPRYIFSSVGIQNSGARLIDALEFVKNKGAIEESIWPYKSGDFNNPSKMLIADTTSNRYKIENYTFLENPSISTLKTTLQSGKFVIVGVTMYNHFYSNTYWYSDENQKNIDDRRTVCIVGYDDLRQAFKFKNSWGEDWGEKGYGYIKYSEINNLLITALYIDL